MARVLENIGKELLRKNRIATPDFRVANDENEARRAAEELGYPVVIKALVTAGKRGKAGGVKFAKNSEEANKFAKEILSIRIGHFQWNVYWWRRNWTYPRNFMLRSRLIRPRGCPSLCQQCRRRRY